MVFCFEKLSVNLILTIIRVLLWTRLTNGPLILVRFIQKYFNWWFFNNFCIFIFKYCLYAIIHAYIYIIDYRYLRIKWMKLVLIICPVNPGQVGLSGRDHFKTFSIFEPRTNNYFKMFYLEFCVKSYLEEMIWSSLLLLQPWTLKNLPISLVVSQFIKYLVS